LPGSVLAMGAWTAIFLFSKYKNFWRSLLVPPTTATLNWQTEVWPMQWRIAVSWLSGYFSMSIFTPVIFYFHGAVAAGQVGLTWSMVMALSLISSSWILTRAPQFGVLVKTKKYRELDGLLLQASRMAVGIALGGALIIYVFIQVLNAYHCPIAGRFLAPAPLLLFLAGTVMMQVSHAQSTFLRAHKREPFMSLSVITAVLIVLSVAIFGRAWAAMGVATAYFLIVALVTVPVGTIIFVRCRQEWGHDRFNLLQNIMREEDYYSER